MKSVFASLFLFDEVLDVWNGKFIIPGRKQSIFVLFDIGVRWDELNKRSCRFVKEKINKLPLDVPRGTKVFPLSKLRDIVVEFYNDVKIHDHSTLAYKDGHYERDLLAVLGIPSINLESFGCPNAEHIFDNLVWVETLVITRFFGHWLSTKKA